MIARDRDGSLLDTDKGMWQQCRFTLATLYNTVEPREEWLAAARHGLEFIEQHGFVPGEGGRMWFHVTREGAPIRKRRYFFTETFGAIAYAACAKATGEARHADRAREIYATARAGFAAGVDPKFAATRPTKGMGVPMISNGAGTAHLLGR